MISTLLKILKKENSKFETCKRTYEEVISLNIPDDELLNRQLTDLINFKKSKDDTFITSKMKKAELKPLWIQLKNYPTPTFQFIDKNPFQSNCLNSTEFESNVNDITMPTVSTTSKSVGHKQTLIVGESKDVDEADLQVLHTSTYSLSFQSNCLKSTEFESNVDDITMPTAITMFF